MIDFYLIKPNTNVIKLIIIPVNSGIIYLILQIIDD